MDTNLTVGYSEQSALKWLYFLMEGQAVQRFHTRPGISPYTDAQHSHGVAMLCWALERGEPSTNLIMAALTHDLAEQAASDVSAPTKRELNMQAVLEGYENRVLYKYDMLHPITGRERRVLKIADQLEGMLYCCRERTMGNKYVDLIYDRWREYLAEELTEEDKEANEIFQAILHMWSVAVEGSPNFDIHKELKQYA